MQKKKQAYCLFGKWLGTESNRRHTDFQSVALPTELPSQVLFNYKTQIINGGGRGIRTPARFDPPVGFQDRSLQPDLGIPPHYGELIMDPAGFEPATDRL